MAEMGGAGAAPEEKAAEAAVTPEETEETLRHADAAMSVVLSQAPYYSAIALHLRPSVTRAVSTAAVNLSLNLYLNPDFWNSIGEPERAGVLVHEIFHILREHPERGGMLNLLKWQIATDLEINDDIIADRWILTPDALYPKNMEFGIRPVRRMVLRAPPGGEDDNGGGAGRGGGMLERLRRRTGAFRVGDGDGARYGGGLGFERRRRARMVAAVGRGAGRTASELAPARAGRRTPG